VGTYTERIARGAAFLDEKQPGWRERIDLEALNLASLENCVLGQVFGHFDGGFAALADAGLVADVATLDYGFDVNGDEDDDGWYSVLTQEWREYIESTRAA
jgi:hypothetical protein